MKPSKHLQNFLILVCFISISFLAFLFPTSPAKVTQPLTSSEHKAVVASTDLNVICQNLKTDMQQINAQRTTLALQQINQQIQVCLPHINFQEQKQLMQLSDQMYQQFLMVDRTPEQQKAFVYYISNQAQYPTIQQNNFEKLNSRDQYLIRHHSQAYIDIIQLDKGQVLYRRHPLYLAKIFAPYLPEAERHFINELASQNLQPLWVEGHLNITANELARRALFWQTYLDNYPKAAYSQDARYLSHYYSQLLFEGGKNSPISEQFAGQDDIQPDMLEEINQLAEQENGTLSQQAQSFLKFIELSPEQRPQIPSSRPMAIGHSQSKVINQLEDYIGLQRLPSRNCFIDAICHNDFSPKPKPQTHPTSVDIAFKKHTSSTPSQSIH